MDREFVTLFGVFNENDGSFTAENLKRYTGDTLRTTKAESGDGDGTGLSWEVALVDANGRCPGGRA